MEVRLDRVTPQERTILENIAEYYVYDFSEFEDHEIRPDGRFGADFLTPYWHSGQSGRHHPFFIKAGGRVVGFVLVEDIGSHMAKLNYLAEFFVTKKYRRHGVGKTAAIQVFDMFGGPWEVMQLQKNTPARIFWRKVIGEYTNGRFEETFSDGRYYQHFWGRV